MYWVKWNGWDEDKKWYNITRLENFLEIIEEFHFCYSEKFRSRILVVWKNKRKRNWIVFYYSFEVFCILTEG